MNTKEWKKTHKGITCVMYAGQRNSARLRGHHLPDYTLSEFRDWCYEQPLFYILYEQWTSSGYKRLSKPSADRIDNRKSYILNNLRLVTFKENASAGQAIACRKPKSELCKRKISQTKRNGKWAMFHSACIRCKTTEIMHQGKGLCHRCYQNKRWVAIIKAREDKQTRTCDPECPFYKTEEASK